MALKHVAAIAFKEDGRWHHPVDEDDDTTFFDHTEVYSYPAIRPVHAKSFEQIPSTEFLILSGLTEYAEEPRDYYPPRYVWPEDWEPHPDPQLAQSKGARWLRVTDVDRPDWESFPVFVRGPRSWRVLARTPHPTGIGTHVRVLARAGDAWKELFASDGSVPYPVLPDKVAQLRKNEACMSHNTEYWRVDLTVQDLIDAEPRFRAFLSTIRGIRSRQRFEEAGVILQPLYEYRS